MRRAMNLHEYQSKVLFSEYGIPVPQGFVAYSEQDARSAAARLGGEVWVVKAQVHAGGRGKAGGVRVARTIDEVGEYAKEMLGTFLVTHQSTENGLPVDCVYIEQGSAIDQEFYLGVLVDRLRERVMVMASAAGGVDIEEVAETSPEKILYGEVSSTGGLEEKEALSLAEGLGLRGSQRSEFINILTKLVKLFYECDASVVEINPLILTSSGHVLALDAKINVEDSALFRQTKLEALRDPNQEDEKERVAREHQLNYVSLEGNIACMVNGAGLAMATMDLIKLHGGEPANFLDVGGDATASRVTEALKIILANKNVEAILVNIFGGIVRCDLIAEGIIDAVREVKMRIPVIVRLEGTNVEKGRMLLANSGLDIIAADNLTDAACKAIASVGSANP